VSPAFLAFVLAALGFAAFVALRVEGVPWPWAMVPGVASGGCVGLLAWLGRGAR
jgi:hypothetical protein